MNFRNALLLAAVVLAPTAALASPDCTTEPQSKWMTETAMKAIVANLGYSVKTFQVTGTCYEIYGKTKDGRRAEVYFNPVSGAIVESEIDG